MGVPSTRTPVRIARGTYANLSTVDALAAIDEGEICFATDQGRLYVKQGAGLTSISSTNEVAPTPAEVTASPAFTGGTGTQSDPYLLTNVGSPFSGGSLTSAHELTISGTAGDIAVFTDNSPTASADRFKGQDVGILNAAGEFKLNLKYTDNPVTTTDNTTYTGNLQIGTTHITWVVVQSNLAPLSEDTTTTITSGSGVGDVITATPGTATGGTAPHSSSVKWQRSFTGMDGWFDTGSTGTSYTISSADAGYYVRAVAVVTDSTDASQGGPLTIDLPSAASAQLNTNQVTTVSSLTLSEDNSAGPRFTSQTYSLDAILNPDGTPTSTKSAKVKFVGTFDQYPSTSNITTITSYMDNINQNGGSSNSLSIYDSNQGYSGYNYGDYSTPVLMLNPDNGEYKFFTHSCKHQSSYQMQMFRSTTPLNPSSGRTPFNPESNEHGYGNRYYTGRGSEAGTGDARYMYDSPTGSSSGWHNWYNPGPVRPLGDNYYFMVGDRVEGPLWTDNVLASTNYWSYPKWFVDRTTDGVSLGPDIGYWHKNYDYAYTDTASHMVWPLKVQSQEFWVRIIAPDVSAGENIFTTENFTDVNLFSKFCDSYGDYQSSEQLRGMWAKGSRIFIASIYYNTSNQYDMRFFYCDFAVNDGTDPNHWILCNKTTDQSSSIFKPGCAIEKNGTRMYLTSTNNGTWRSNDNGSSWIYAYRPILNVRTDVFSNSNLGYTQCAYIGNLLYFVCRRYSNSDASSYDGNMNNSRYMCTFWSSNDNGVNWNWEGWQVHSDWSSSYPQIDPARGGRSVSIREEGGWILIRGKNQSDDSLRGFAIPHYQTITFADSTNLGNDSIRPGNKLRQGQTTFHISQANQTTKVYTINGGDIVTGEPATNTVSYFGGSQSTLYAVLNGAGTILDLTSSDPGFVNVGYGVNNTITFPSTLPSGNTPDVELPTGTTMQATVEFANSQGTITADSNTLTP